MRRAAFFLALIAASPAYAGSEVAAAPKGAVMGTGLRVSDLDRSIRFYTEVLGMSVAMRLPHATLTEVMLGFGGQPHGPSIILMRDSAPGKSPPIVLGDGFEKIVLDMPDLSAIVARLKERGLPVGEIHSAMGVRIVFITDPDGYRYELIERSAASSKG